MISEKRVLRFDVYLLKLKPIYTIQIQIPFQNSVDREHISKAGELAREKIAYELKIASELKISSELNFRDYISLTHNPNSFEISFPYKPFNGYELDKLVAKCGETFAHMLTHATGELYIGKKWREIYTLAYFYLR